MKDKEAKIALRDAVDHRLSALEGNPWLARQIIQQSKGEQPYMKKKLSLGLVMTIMTIVVMATAALATDGFGLFGSVDWNGVFHADETQPDMDAVTPTAAPMPAEELRLSAEERADAILAARQPGELVMVSLREADGVMPLTSAQRTASVTSMDELETLLTDAPWLDMPMNIPEGYVLDEAHVIYERYATGAYDAPVREETEDGLIVERYALDPAQDFIRGYDLTFRSSDEDYHYISIYASLRAAEDGYAMDVNPEQTVARVEVEGMDDALCMMAEDRCVLVMRRALKEEITYAEHPGSIEQAGIYAELQVDVRAPLLTQEEIVEVVTAR